MGAQRADNNSASAGSVEDLVGFGIAVVREEGRWQCTPLTGGVLTSLRTAEKELLELRSSGAVFGLLDVDEEFFVIVRPAPTGTRLLISDATAAIDYDIAADVLDLLRVEPPDEEDTELWPEGDLGVLADLGMPSHELQIIVDEVDLYPDEQLQMIAQRIGFIDEFTKLLDTIQA